MGLMFARGGGEGGVSCLILKGPTPPGFAYTPPLKPITHLRGRWREFGGSLS